MVIDGIRNFRMDIQPHKKGSEVKFAFKKCKGGTYGWGKMYWEKAVSTRVWTKAAMTHGQ